MEPEQTSNGDLESGAPEVQPSHPGAKQRGRVRWGLISSLVLLTVIIILAVQNPQLTTIRFLTWKTPEVSLSVVILGSALIAILLDELFGVFWRLRRRRQSRAAKPADSKEA